MVSSLRPDTNYTMSWFNTIKPPLRPITYEVGTVCPILGQGVGTKNFVYDHIILYNILKDSKGYDDMGSKQITMINDISIIIIIC